MAYMTCVSCVRSRFFHRYCPLFRRWIRHPSRRRCDYWTDEKHVIGGDVYYVVKIKG